MLGGDNGAHHHRSHHGRHHKEASSVGGGGGGERKKSISQLLTADFLTFRGSSGGGGNNGSCVIDGSSSAASAALSRRRSSVSLKESTFGVINKLIRGSSTDSDHHHHSHNEGKKTLKWPPELTLPIRDYSSSAGDSGGGGKRHQLSTALHQGPPPPPLAFPLRRELSYNQIKSSCSPLDDIEQQAAATTTTAAAKSSDKHRKPSLKTRRQSFFSRSHLSKDGSSGGGMIGSLLHMSMSSSSTAAEREEKEKEAAEAAACPIYAKKNVVLRRKSVFASGALPSLSFAASYHSGASVSMDVEEGNEDEEEAEAAAVAINRENENEERGGGRRSLVVSTTPLQESVQLCAVVTSPEYSTTTTTTTTERPSSILISGGEGDQTNHHHHRQHPPHLPPHHQFPSSSLYHPTANANQLALPNTLSPTTAANFAALGGRKNSIIHEIRVLSPRNSLGGVFYSSSVISVKTSASAEDVNDDIETLEQHLQEATAAAERGKKNSMLPNNTGTGGSGGGGGKGGKNGYVQRMKENAELQERIRKFCIYFRWTSWMSEREEHSLFLFSPENACRRYCRWLADHPHFDYFVLIFISLNCITLAMERPKIPPWSREREFLSAANYIFTVVFGLEMLVKVVAKGLFYGRDAYFHNGWNIMDGSLVGISLFDIFLSFFAQRSPRIFGILRVFRLLRSLRPLR